MPYIYIYTVDIGYSYIGYSDILDIVIISPKNPCPQRYHYIQYVLYTDVQLAHQSRS